MRIAVDNAQIDVVSDGNGDAVVLLHGFPLTRDVWNLQAQTLAARARVIRPDLRGMGASSVSAGPYLMEVLAGDVAALLDALGIERATLVGHSLGGYVAMAFCRMYTERVARLALVCSRLAADSPEAARAREELADRVERDASIEPVIDAYLPRLLAPQTMEQRPQIAQRVRELAHANTPSGSAAMMRGMAQRVASDDIAEDLTMPVLIVSGAHDLVVPQEESAQMQRAFPNATAAILQNSGHLPMLEEPEELTAVLERFIAETPG